MKDIQTLTNAILEAGADVAYDYTAYLQLCFSLVDACGEEGRPFFHRICEVNPSYDFKQADHLYSYCLQHSRGKHTLGTAVLLAQRAGVKTEALRNIDTQKPCNFATEGGPKKSHMRADI